VISESDEAMTRKVPAVFCAAVFSMGASAQQPYPVKPIRLIAPGSAGSPPDVMARLWAEQLASHLGQPLVVDNRPGAVGTIGLNVVAKAPADGYTLGILSLSYAVAPALVAKMPYDTEKDLTAVSLIARESNMLVVPGGSSARSVAELIKVAKAKPGLLRFASGGNGTPAHLGGELFKRETGVDIAHIPYKGAVAGVVALLTGDVDLMFGATVAVSPHIKSGKLRALATIAPRRIPAYPDVPTVAELGYANAVVAPWAGVVAPAGTPKAAVARLHLEMKKIGAMPETKQRLEAIGLEWADVGPGEFAALIRSEMQKWIKLIRDAGIRPG
jgi:tripartite-type tricarboxylate transporter receptor subunit TctC